MYVGTCRWGNTLLAAGSALMAKVKEMDVHGFNVGWMKPYLVYGSICSSNSLDPVRARESPLHMISLCLTACGRDSLFQ